MSERDIQSLALRLNMSPEEVKKRVDDVANTKFSAITDPQKRLQQAFIYVRAKLLARPPGKDVTVVVYGIREPINKASRKISRVYVLRSTETQKITKSVIVLSDDLSPEYKNAKLFQQYTVNVVEGGKNLLLGTPMTQFKGGKAVKPEKVLELLKSDPQHFVEFSINEAMNYLSNTNGNYIDEFDLRATKGIVTRVNFKKNDKGEITFSVYELADPDNPEQTITAWVPPPLLMYDEGSLLYVYGTLQLTKNNTVQLQVQGILPLEAIPLTEV